MSATIQSGATSDLLIVDPTSKAARVTLYDASGNALEIVTEGSSRYLGVSIRQDVHTSTNNSSVAQINTGATWTGTGETTLGVAGIQVNTYLDQPHTVFVDQSADNANWYIVDSYPVPASFGQSRTIQATDNYFRARVQNTGGSNATIVSINTALCPVVEALPRSLTSGGNLKVTPSAEWQDPKAIIGLYQVSTFLTVGSAATPQNLFALNNPGAPTSKNNIALRQITITSDSTAALTTVAQRAILSRPSSLATGGTTLTSVKMKTSYGTASGVALGATASDSGVLTTITATAGTAIWTQFLDRPHTLAGWFPHTVYPMLPEVGADLRQNILVPGESILIQVVGNAPATTQMIVNCSWYEYLAF
jgi:hypothetical protein